MGLLKRLRGQRSITATSFEGADRLEVKGESFHQESLRRIVAKLGREVPAVLLPEPENKFDRNAVSVWVGGQLVGHLSRDDAPLYQPALARLMKEEGTPIAVKGRIFGGERDKPSLGIWLYHDRSLFGLAPHKPNIHPSMGPRTGASEANSKWLDGLPADRLAAIKYLRATLEKESSPIQRHFIFNSLEEHLYASREVFGSALSEFEEVCERHHDEMGPMRAALIAEFRGVPMLPTYRQMAIMKQKAHAYSDAISWVERGLTIYGDDCLREDAVADLQKRSQALHAKLGRDPGRREPLSEGKPDDTSPR